MQNPTKFLLIQKALFDAMRDKAQSALGQQGRVKLQSVNIGSAGNFPWYYDNQGDFNLGTYNFLNQTVEPDPAKTGALAFGNTFTNDYLTVIGAISYVLSPADQHKLTTAQTNSSLEASALVSLFQSTYGAITPQDLKDAKMFHPTKADYIISYVAGKIWSGDEKGIPYTQMLKAPQLSKLFPNRPPSSDKVIAGMAKYLNAISSVASLIDEGSAGVARLTAIKDAVNDPTNNGGMSTVSPHGAGPMKPVYQINESEQAIKTALGNSSSSLTVNLSASMSNSSQLKVSVEGSAGFTIPIDFVEIGVKGGASYNLAEASGNSASYDINAVFPGPMLVTTTPEKFDVSGQTGWFDTGIIHDAILNQTKHETGFQFTNTPPFTLGQNGNFGLLNALAISQFPTIKINFKQGDYASYKKVFQEGTETSVKLFGLCKVAGSSQNVYKATSSANSSGSGFTMTLSPGPNNYIDPSGQSLANLAYVLGAQAMYPGA